MKSRCGKLLLVAMLIGLFSWSCSKSEGPAEAPKKALEPIKIGVAGPHSGDLASYGIPTVKAARACG